MYGIYKMKRGCELCDYVPITTLHYENGLFRVFDCKNCEGIVLAIKEHKETLTIEELKQIADFIKSYFGDDVLIRTRQRNIKNHLHFHIYSKEVGKCQLS